MDRKINISNMPEGHGIEISGLHTLIEHYYDKLNNILPEEMLLDVHFKEFHKQGRREQVETKVKVNAAGITMQASAKEWGAEKSLKSSLEALEKEVIKFIAKKKAR